jgi:hypothetical protein
MQPRALVAGRNIGEAVRGLDREDFEDFHDCIVELCAAGVMRKSLAHVKVVAPRAPETTTPSEEGVARNNSAS